MTAKRQTTTTIKKLMGGRLRLERRNKSLTIYARTFAQGKDRVKNTGETGLTAATTIAEEWWHEVRLRVRNRENLDAPTFAHAATEFLDNAFSEHSASQVENFRDKWSVLKNYFGELPVTDVDKSFLLNLRGKRSQTLSKNGAPIRNATLKKDLLFIRLVLRYALDAKKWIAHLPELPAFPRNSKWAIRPKGRPRFTSREYLRLLRMAFRRMRQPGLNPRTRRQREELTYFIVIVTGAALRVGEAYSIRWCDCGTFLVDNTDWSRDDLRKSDVDAYNLLTISVMGKHSNGIREEARGTKTAYKAHHRLHELRKAELASDKRPRPESTEKIFLHDHRDGFRDLLAAAGLRVAADGQLRNLKSLRPTGISFQLDSRQQPNYVDVAKWTRTSVAMIEKFYDQRDKSEAMDRVMMQPPKPKRPRHPDEPVKSPPVLLHRVEPTYPLAAQTAGVSGVVGLTITIDTNGRVADPEVFKSIPLLDQAALDAVVQWKYTPAMRDGVAVECDRVVTLHFEG